jgi:transposase
VQDRHGAVAVLTRLKRRFPNLQLVWADSAYAGPQLAERFDALGSWRLVIVRKPPGQGFSVLAKRWIVERSFAWIGRCRRLAKDFENLARIARAFVLLAMIRLLLRRLARGCS